MSGTEIVIILIVGIIVVGPKRLPGMMRTMGRWISKARRTIFEVRANTGIDKLIREEGLENEIRELSSLTRSNVLGSLVQNPLTTATRTVSAALTAPTAPRPAAKKPSGAVVKPLTAGADDAAKKADSSDPKVEVKEVDDSAASPAMMTGPAPSAAALSLIKPATNTVARGNEDALRALMTAASPTSRDREYPTIGCDSYDVMPDDIDDPDAYAELDAAAEGESGHEPPAATEVANGTAADEAIKDEAVKHEAAKDEAAKDEAVKDEAVKHEAVKDEAAKKVPAPEKPAERAEPIEDKRAV